jgi:hypothetical protein
MNVGAVQLIWDKDTAHTLYHGPRGDGEIMLYH